jgi:hypothetical protein
VGDDDDPLGIDAVAVDDGRADVRRRDGHDVGMVDGPGHGEAQVLALDGRQVVGVRAVLDVVDRQQDRARGSWRHRAPAVVDDVDAVEP